MNELTDEEINVVTVEQWADKTYPLAAYRTYARAIIQKDRAKRQADPALLTDEQCAGILASAEGAWNAQADAFNQWGSLGCDEKLLLAGSALIAADRALRQAGQEPYGYEYDKLCDDSMGRGWEKCFARTVPSYETVQNVKPLFTAPPAPQPAQVPLTDEQIKEALIAAGYVPQWPSGDIHPSAYAGARAIEQAHHIK